MNSKEISELIEVINHGSTCEFNHHAQEQAFPACCEIRMIEKNRVKWWQYYTQTWPLKPATKHKLMLKGSPEMIAAYASASINKGKKLPFNDEKTLLLRDDAKLVMAYLSGGTSFSTKAIAWAADNCSQEIVDAIIASN